jgi:methyltransferase
MVTWYLALLALLGLERIGELLLSRRNAAVMVARGAIEVGQRHFRAMKLLHTAFLVACAAEVIVLRRPFVPLLAVAMLVLVILAQVLRYWAVFTLGTRWNVRVLVTPGDAAVVTGPYRYVRHPNYLAVIVEGFAVPLVHSAWLTALAFTVCNAALLTVRIRCEEAALAEHCRYRERVGTLRRFIPRPRPAAT